MRSSIFKIPASIASIALVCFAVLPGTKAVTPAPDGGYPNQNTAEGHDALLSLTTGKDNTALGDDALQANTIGSSNTATGSNTLKSNTSGNENTGNGNE